jgi:oxygen-independent coproporphyrinogen-3 oxidase
MLEARLSDGMSLDWLKGKDFATAEAISSLLAERLIDGPKVFAGTITLTLKGRLLADYVVRKLLG